MDFSDIQKIAEIDLYEILNVNHKDDIRKIKKKYRKLVLKVHPDKPNGDKEVYELVNLSYTVLKNDKLRALYDSARKEFLENNKSFDLLKKDSHNNINKKLLTKEEAQKEYYNLESVYNDKHGYNIEDSDPISQSEMMKRLNKLNYNRENFTNVTKSCMKKMNVSNTDFNEKFIKDGVIDNDIGKDIIAYNDASNMSLINYSGIDNFDLYNNNGSNTSNYSSLDSAFNHKLPGDINNNYSDHNSISNTDRDNYKDEMSEYNNFTNTIKNMKISDFN
jgi:curved DNA-binding protein CbpA